MASTGGDGDPHWETDLDLNLDLAEEDDQVCALPDINEVIKAKERDPMSFVSGFEGDDDGIVLSDRPDDPGERFLSAAESGDLEEVKHLLGTNPPGLITYRDDDGYTVLHRACCEDHLEVATLLIAQGAEIDAASGGGWTSLHSACHWNSFRCVRLLLENGADINARTNGGLTPLHVACGGANNTRETLIILLSEPGLNVDIRSNIDETAYDLAKRYGQLHYLFEMFRKPICKI